MLERYIETEDFLKLPLSGGRYLIKLNGEIKDDATGCVLIPRSDSLGELVIFIDWLKGPAEYKLAFVLAVTFKPLHLPSSLWSEPTLMFRDDNVKNIHPSNLIWKFPIGLESKRYPGYAFIPGFSRYLINKEGVVLHHLTGNQITKIIDEKGYCDYAIKPDIGVWTKVGRYRLLCLAFKDYPSNIDSLDINHIDGIPSNDDLNNLEFNTRLENCIHAFKNKLRKDNKFVLVENIKTGIITEHFSVAECVRKENVSYPELINGIRSNAGFLLKDDLKFYFKDPINKTHIAKHTPAIPVLSRNVITGEIAEYPSKNSFAAAFKLSILTVEKRLKVKGQPIFRENIQIKLKNDPVPWRVPESIEAEGYYESWERRVLLRDTRTGKITEYTGIAECAKALGVSKDTVSWRVHSPGLKVFPDYNQYKFLNDSRSWNNLIEIRKTPIQIKLRKPVLLKNILTGDVLEYAKQSECAKALGVSLACMTKWLSLDNQPVLPGFIQVKLKNDSVPWRTVENVMEELNIYKGIKPVLVRNTLTKTINEYSSLNECARITGINVTTLWWRVKTNGNKTYPGNLQFKYKGDSTPWLE